jgi:GNAT superfamily N-acetyltransferase
MQTVPGTEIASTPTGGPSGQALVAIRPARDGDRSALDALMDRCSPETLRRRFHGGDSPSARRDLVRLASPGAGHRSWVALDRSGAVRGTATLAFSASGATDVAFLVEDGWSRRGIGRMLARALAAEARRSGRSAVAAWVHADNQPAVRFLRALFPGARAVHHGRGDLEFILPVAVPASAPATAGTDAEAA